MSSLKISALAYYMVFSIVKLSTSATRSRAVFRPYLFDAHGPLAGPFSSGFQGNSGAAARSLLRKRSLGPSRTLRVRDGSYDNIFPFSVAGRNFLKIIRRFILVSRYFFLGLLQF